MVPRMSRSTDLYGNASCGFPETAQAKTRPTLTPIEGSSVINHLRTNTALTFPRFYRHLSKGGT